MISGLQYMVKFMIDDPRAEELYLQYRNIWLEEQTVPAPTTALSSIPLELLSRCRKLVISDAARTEGGTKKGMPIGE